MASDKTTQLPVSIPPLFNSKTDEWITRLSKVLSTSSGVDSTLHLIGYGLLFASSQISNIEKLELKAFTNSNASTTTLKHGSSSLLKLAQLETSARTIASMCSDFRAFTRLWGLLGVYATAKKHYVDPPKDAVVRAVSYAQTLSIGAYYFYENGYYLANKGVLRGWMPVEIKRWAKTSMRMFMVFVMLEFVRLYRVRQRREKRKLKAVDEEDIQSIEAEEAGWSRSALMNVAYMPLSMHWASESGMLSEGVVGGLMSLLGWMKFKAAYDQTA